MVLVVKVKFIGLLSLIPFLLVGCNSNTNGAIEVEKYNSLKIFEEYDKNLSSLNTVEENVLNYILTENIELSLDDFIGSSISKSLVVAELNKVKDYIKVAIDSDSLLADELLKSGETKELENTLIRDYEYFRDNIISYHFLSKDNCSIEQYIVLYDGSTIFKVSLNWIGGVIADAKVYRYN